MNRSMCLSPLRNRNGYILLLGIIFLLAGCSIKPKPILDQEHLKTILSDRTKIYEGQPPLEGPLSLSEAIARTLKYNYDHRLSMMESVLQHQQLGTATYDMLPKLAASAGYNTRSNVLSSYSLPLDGSSSQGSFLTSQDKTRHLADLSFSWNILDFGVSYYQAKQQADRFLIAGERRRRVVSYIISEATSAYWRAAAAEKLLPIIKGTLEEAEEALAANREIERQRLEPIVQTLRFRKDLLRIIEQLRELSANMGIAKTQLAALVNVPMTREFQIASPDADLLKPPRLNASIGELENIGLFNRPDLREAVYLERIDLADVHKEMLRMLPGLTLSSSANYDSNSFLLNSEWTDAAGLITFNLFNLISGPKKIETAKTKVAVSKTRRLALSVAAMVQINIAYQQYIRALDTYQSATALSDVEERLDKAISDAGSLRARSKLEMVRQSAATIAAKLKRDSSLADTYAALSNLYVSLGADLYEGPIDNVELPDLTQRIRPNLEAWLRGELPILPERLPSSETGAE
jgi:multidrug efflux system outer membrane protein